MPISYGDKSSSRSREVFQSDIKAKSISSPAGGESLGSPIDITYVLESDAGATATTVQFEYSTDGGSTFGNTCTADATDPDHEGTTSISTDEDGVSHTFVWDSAADLTTSFQSSTIVVRVRATDGSNYSTWAESGTFEIDMLPAAPTLVSPDNLYFDSDTTPDFVFTVPNDPGSDRIYVRVEIDNSPSFASPDIDHNSQDNASAFRHRINSSPGTKNFANRQRYYVRDLSVTSYSLTTVSYSSLSSHYTESSLPSTLTNPQILLINRADRRCFIDPSTITTTGFDIAKSSAGVDDDGTVDLIIWSDDVGDFDSFWVDLSGVTDNTSYTYGTSPFDTDVLGQTIPASISNCRPMVLEGNDCPVYLESVTDTGFTVRLSSGKVESTATLRVCLRSDPSEAYISTGEAVTSFTETLLNFDQALDDITNGSNPWPDYVPGPHLFAQPTADRLVIMDRTFPDTVDLYKSSSGVDDDGQIDVHGCSEKDSSITYWTDVSINGIPDTYETNHVRYRVPDADALATGFHSWRARAGNA